MQGRRLNCVGAIAYISRSLQLEAVSSLVKRLSLGPADAAGAPAVTDAQALVLFSHYDASPMLVHFGAFADLVTPHARFLHFDKTLKRWRALPVEAFQDVSQRAVPRKGVVQVLAQRMQVCQGGLASHAYFAFPRLPYLLPFRSCLDFQASKRALPPDHTTSTLRKPSHLVDLLRMD